MNDLMSRARMADSGPQQAPSQQHVPQQQTNKKRRGFSPMKFISGILLISVTILVLAMLAFLVFGGNKSESELINNDDYQAVFLNDQSGQVYFGKLSVINTRLYKLTDIYYVRVDTPVQPEGTNQTAQQNISLAKLGNELHGPQDEMFINKDQVLFWENLKDDGQVVKAITEYKQNGGQTNNANNNSSTNNSSNTNSNTNSNSNNSTNSGN